ncbi:septation protein SepH [Sinomonas halotolerans]|uniref:Septation protein SepH n=1 Tax=Sinomonas halotolerans TaxID=1644133 RepID=A0ABU9X2H9_9MICC
MREQPQDHAQQLRLVGVHEDGAHLLVSASSGEVFRLPLDEALRRAVARPAPQRSAGGDGSAMSPRQIQAEIRAGATAEEVAESSGVPLARVQRYEGPVLAEREHMARRAQSVEVPGRLPSHDVLRGVAAERPVTLGEMVAYRLSLHGVGADDVSWDSWRRSDGQWTVVARFPLPQGSPSTIGEEPPAQWTYHPVHRTVANANRWAQQLSELEPLDGPAPRRRLAAVSDRPFDVEADLTPEPPHAAAPPAATAAPGSDPEGELLDMLRARRGQRLGVDEDGDDALALLLTHGIPAAHPRPSETAADEGDGRQEQHPFEGEGTFAATPAAQASEPEHGAHGLHDDDAEARGGITSLLTRLERRAEDPIRGHLGLMPGLSTATTEISISAATPSAATSGGTDGAEEDGAPAPPEGPRGGSDADDAREEPSPPRRRGSAEQPSGTGQPSDPPRRARAKRSSVPSWDEIVFGTKGD